MSEEPAHSSTPDADGNEPPPILGSWRNLYLLLVLELLAITAVLFALTKWLS
jgi:hypothetical protein